MSDSPKQSKAETTPHSPVSPAEPAPAPAAQAEQVAPAGEIEPKLTPKSKAKRNPPRLTQLPPFRVVLHDDERIDMTHVVRSIVELTPLSAPLARDIMLNAHEHGSAPVLVTHLERAELYQELFACKGLTVTIEPAL